MVESLIDLGKYFCWGLGLLAVLVIVYALVRILLMANALVMRLLSAVLPISACVVVATAVGAYLGSLLDSMLGIDQAFAMIGVVAGLVFGVFLWRRTQDHPAI